jgi:DNA-binding NarL/FixJ family response regulator
LTAEAERARLADGADSVVAWEAGSKRWRELGRPFQSGYCDWRMAEAYLRGGNVAEGVAALRRAHATADELGARRLAEELEAVSRWYRLDAFVPSSPIPEQRHKGQAEASLAEYGLTPREREVLVALAAGRTNGEIAKELFISVKTASVHVSNILKKLDVDGRQDAARLAHRLGIGS